MKIYITGELVEEADAKISVFDHGFLYGDGIFEGIRVYNKCVFKLEEHLERLEYSAKAIMFDMPWSRREISDAVCETCRANNIIDGYVRLCATRGRGTLGLNPKVCEDPQLIVIAGTIQLYPEDYYTEGLKIITVPTRRVNPAALPPMIKSLNYLNNILAKLEAINQGYMEALMLNDQGYVAECTGDNIYIVRGGGIFTPPTSSGALKGITRDVTFAIAQEKGLALTEIEMTRYDLWIADECFLTGTAAEIIPVTEIDGRKIGSGRPGTLTQQLMSAFQEKLSLEGTIL